MTEQLLTEPRVLFVGSMNEHQSKDIINILVQVNSHVSHPSLLIEESILELKKMILSLSLKTF
jgi:DNA-directed RNA polymerase subunit L